MFRSTYLKKFLLSGGTYGTYAATIVSPGDTESGDKSSSGNCDPRTGKLVRRSELPLYGECTEGEKPQVCEEDPSNIEKGVSAVRKELWVWQDTYDVYREKVVDVIVTGKEHTAVLIDQLRKDELPIPRSGAIAISGLAGVVLGLRGGWFRRIFYGTTCAGIMAAICYPKEVAELSQETLEATKKYVKITYNFIYGVKPESFKLPSPSEFLGGPVETSDNGYERKSSAPAVSENDPKKSSRPNDQSNPSDTDLYSSKR